MKPVRPPRPASPTAETDDDVRPPAPARRNSVRAGPERGAAAKVDADEPGLSVLSRRGLLARLQELAAAKADADAEVIAARFHRDDRVRMRRFASASFQHGDVAEQFPYLAYQLALRLVAPAQRQAAEAAIHAGAPLQKVARLAGVPMWTRMLPPAACHDVRGALPDSPDFACRISDVLRRRIEAGSDLRGVMRTMALVYGEAGEDMALWLALRHPEGGLMGELSMPVRMLVLWHLLSLTQGLGHDLIHTAWSREVGLENSLRAVKNFVRRIELELLVGPAGVADPWYAREQLMDLVFVPLLTSTDIRAEALRNHNCVDWYGRRLATNEVRLFSVRTTEGRCVANVELSGSEAYPSIPRIAQIKAPRNEPAEPYVSGVADIWLRRQIRTHGCPEMRRRKAPTPDANRWQEIVAPLAASGRLPAWAREAPSNRELTQGELEFTVLGCRLRTRGWRFA